MGPSNLWQDGPGLGDLGRLVWWIRLAAALAGGALEREGWRRSRSGPPVHGSLQWGRSGRLVPSSVPPDSCAMTRSPAAAHRSLVFGSRLPRPVGR